ncbi:MAG: hypothetical protein JW873_00240 [Candidatus Saganbacteria bacterium]|nr:hypothetical protein [Candidatus Saganbacteria bacterium]
MNEWAVRFVEITNMNPAFKGGSVALVGALALLFALWMRSKWHEPLKGGFLAFIAAAAFVTLYGLFVLLLQPRWWNLPY